MRNLSLSLAILIFISKSLFAQQYIAEEISPNTWLKVVASSSGTVLKVLEKDMINQTDFNPTIWLLQDHSKDKYVKHRKSMSLHKFDCKMKKSAIVKVTLYFSDGSVKDTWENKYPDFNYVTPDSVIEAVMEAACPKQN